jgi:hypothetical protein
MEKSINAPEEARAYSLHDGELTGMTILEDALVLEFASGFVETTPPYQQVAGSVRFEQVDWDFSYAYLMEYEDALCGNVGRFTGEKMTLADFAGQDGSWKIDVVDETYGYNLAKLDGFLSRGEALLECRLEIYHLGKMCYHVNV